MFMLLLLGFAGFCSCQMDAPEPRYVIVFESPVYVVEGSDMIRTDGIKCERYNETAAYMYGEVEFLQTMDNLILEIFMHKVTSNKLVLIGSHDICNLCEEMGNKEGTYQKYLKYMAMPEKCPFETGVFKINNLAVEMDEFQFTDTHCGSYVIDLNMLEQTGPDCKLDRKQLFTLKMEISIEREE